MLAMFKFQSRKQALEPASLADMAASVEKWDLRYLDLAKQVATWSKDPSTQVGAVAVGAKRDVLSTGYNGFPRGMNDHPDIYSNRPMKLERVVHAEMNVIYNASFSGTSLNGATLYIDGLPLCSHCALGVIQVGIKRVVSRCPEKIMVPGNHWFAAYGLTRGYLDEAGVKYKLITTP